VGWGSSVSPGHLLGQLLTAFTRRVAFISGHLSPYLHAYLAPTGLVYLGPCHLGPASLALGPDLIPQDLNPPRVVMLAHLPSRVEPLGSLDASTGFPI